MDPNIETLNTKRPNTSLEGVAKKHHRAKDFWPRLG